jgi:hypothetical protein
LLDEQGDAVDDPSTSPEVGQHSDRENDMTVNLVKCKCDNVEHIFCSYHVALYEADLRSFSKKVDRLFHRLLDPDTTKIDYVHPGR